jgi:hypothetical protein
MATLVLLPLPLPEALALPARANRGSMKKTEVQRVDREGIRRIMVTIQAGIGH